MEAAGHYLRVMRETAPLVHNITNYVAMNMMANVIIAAGAAPAMVHARVEVEEFAAIAQALTVNIGTTDPDWSAAMEAAGAVMGRLGRPWVLDPVGIGATRYRRDLCARLLDLRPAVIRGNASEILTLAGAGGAAQGVDARDEVTAAEEPARALARRTGGVVAVTGPVDYVTDGARAFRVANGDPMMTRVTVLGCSLNGVIAAFAIGQPLLEATAAALAYYGLAGERAALVTRGPGSFQAGFLDQLYLLTPDEVSRNARIEAA